VFTNSASDDVRARLLNGFVWDGRDIAMDIPDQEGRASATSAELVRLIQKAIDTVKSMAEAFAALDEVARVLEALPVTTADYQVMSHHLLNARRYLACGERGAALYEIDMVACPFRPSRTA